MSRLLVLGASGATGQHLVAQALDAGHHVTAVSRHPEAVRQRHDRLRLEAADLSAGVESLARLIPGHDTVISTLGRGLRFTSRSLMARATPVIVTAMERSPLRRLVYLSAYGVGGSAPDAHWTDRLFQGLMLRDIYADKAIGERAVQDSRLDWTILAPVRLTGGRPTGRFRLGPPEPLGPVSMPRADLAAAILACLEDPTTIRRRLVVSP